MGTRIKLEPWTTDIAHFWNVDEKEEENVELLENWGEVENKDIAIKNAMSSHKISFIDGTRRLDTFSQIYSEKLNSSLPVTSAFLSISAGYFTTPTLKLETKLKRYFVVLTNEKIIDTDTISVSNNLNYTVEYVRKFRKDETPHESIEKYSNDLMRKIEFELLPLSVRDSDFVVIDGNFPSYEVVKNIRKDDIRKILAHVKSLHVIYTELDKLYTLKPLERSPIFRIDRKKDNTFSIYSWYVKHKIERPKNHLSDISDISRFEIISDKDEKLENLKYIAEMSRFIVGFFSYVHGGRAPQNLPPVAFLEKNIYRLLGSKEIIFRSIADYLSKQ